MIALKANQAQTFGEIRSRSVARPAAGAHGLATLSDKGKKPSHLIDYARRWFAEERWPMSPKLRAVRAIMEKLDPKPKPPPLSEPAARRVELADGEEAEAIGYPKALALLS
jgi:hypothetical protein